MVNLLFLLFVFLLTSIIFLLIAYIVRLRKENKELYHELYSEIDKNMEIEKHVVVIEKPIALKEAKYCRILTANAFFMRDTLYPTSSTHPIIIVQNEHQKKAMVFLYNKQYH